MAHDHDHDAAHDHSHGATAYRETDRKALKIAAALTAGFMLVEVAGGLITGSLALLADAAHMLSDSFSLILALVAVGLAARPATSRRTFGYKRAEILAALANGLLLALVSVWVVIEAIRRLSDPVEVLAGGMLVVAVIGLVVNVVAAWVLYRSAGESLNVKAALRHVLADLAGSIGVIIAALVIMATGWEAIDPIISILISLLIVASAWSIVRDSVDVLLEAVPRGLDADEIGMAMASVPAVAQVHELHVWEITSGFPSLSAHVLVGPDSDCHAARSELESVLLKMFEIDHVTLQVELLGKDPLLAVDSPLDC